VALAVALSDVKMVIDVAGTPNAVELVLNNNSFMQVFAEIGRNKVSVSISVRTVCDFLNIQYFSLCATAF